MLKKLKNILPESVDYKVIGDSDIKINNIQLDSRKVKANDVFVAIDGFAMNGHKFIPQAIAAGCICVVSEETISTQQEGVCYIVTEDSRMFLGELVNNFFDRPSQQLKLIGVTGTNGKTSIATVLFKLFKILGHKVGLISTVENLVNDKVIESEHSTPDAISLTELLSQMVDAKCDYAFMEVSSHAIHQQRIAGQQFAGGVFTNITHDHLDYHETFKEYIRVKKMFFDQLPKSAFAITNVDDRNGELMIQNTKAKVIKYSLRTLVDYKAKIIANDFSGLQLDINGQEVHSRLLGKFNAYNLLAVYATAEQLEFESDEILQAISRVAPVEGRFDVIHGKGGRVGIVDYAHSPDALEKIITTIKSIDISKELIVLIGCGGDRDKAKRSVMGKIAASLSDTVIFTSDNPRSEDPDEILKAMHVDLSKEEEEKVIEIEDRGQAIKTAVKISKPGDIILIAGKGHEKYQEIKGVKVPFDDKEKLTAHLGQNDI